MESVKFAYEQNSDNKKRLDGVFDVAVKNE